MRTAEIGTIIQGTLVTEELVSAFADELERLEGDPELIQRARDWQELDEDQGERGEAWEEEGNYLVNDLIDALNEASPPYCYFGSSEGDGSDFGFWIADDSLYEAIRDGDVVERDDSQRHPLNMPEYVYHLSDHGNPTLYKIELTVVW